MSHSPSSVAVPFWRTGVVVLLLLFGYSIASGILYLLWSRSIGWPVIEGENEVLLRLVHLLPALVCSALAGGIGGVTNRVKPLFPAALLGLGIAVAHYSSYSWPSRTAPDDIVAAIVESLALYAIAFASFWMLAGRREPLKPTQ